MSTRTQIRDAHADPAKHRSPKTPPARRRQRRLPEGDDNGLGLRVRQTKLPCGPTSNRSQSDHPSRRGFRPASRCLHPSDKRSDCRNPLAGEFAARRAAVVMASCCPRGLKRMDAGGRHLSVQSLSNTEPIRGLKRRSYVFSRKVSVIPAIWSQITRLRSSLAS